jgi:hypothetical protein
MEQENVHREKEFQSKTNPKKRVEKPRGIFFLQKDEKKKYYFSFRLRKAFIS